MTPACRAALALGALLVALLALALTASAAEPLAWHVGSLGPGAAWWYAYGCDADPVVTTVPPRLGGGWCSPGGVATVYANPGWGEVRVGGQVVAMRVWLVEVGR